MFIVKEKFWARLSDSRTVRNSLTYSSHYFSHSLISRWHASYLHTCNPLASSVRFIYETIVSDRTSTSEKIAARREEVASRLNSSRDHDYLLISTSFARIFWHSSFSLRISALRDEREREIERERKIRDRRYTHARCRCACASLTNGWQRHVLSYTRR